MTNGRLGVATCRVRSAVHGVHPGRVVIETCSPSPVMTQGIRTVKSCPAPERRYKNPPHKSYEVVDIHLRSSCGNLPPELAPCVHALVAGLLRADPSTTLDERRVYSVVEDDNSSRLRVRQMAERLTGLDVRIEYLTALRRSLQRTNRIQVDR